MPLLAQVTTSQGSTTYPTSTLHLQIIKSVLQAACRLACKLLYPSLLYFTFYRKYQPYVTEGSGQWCLQRRRKCNSVCSVSAASGNNWLQQQNETITS